MSGRVQFNRGVGTYLCCMYVCNSKLLGEYLMAYSSADSVPGTAVSNLLTQLDLSVHSSSRENFKQWRCVSLT